MEINFLIFHSYRTDTFYLFLIILLCYCFDHIIQKKFRSVVRRKMCLMPDVQNQYSPRMFSETFWTLCVRGATPRPHQMPYGNATSHEYRTDTFRAKTDVSNHVTEIPVLLPVLKPQLWVYVSDRPSLYFNQTTNLFFLVIKFCVYNK